MATTIKWIDNNSIETAHRIYKSNTYFTKDNLPAPLVELGPDITEYVDSAGADGENWYIVSALLNDYEVFSEPFIAGLSTAYIHDVFNDGSAVATYNFDGDATDLGGTYNGTWAGTESYVAGNVRQAASFSIGTDSVITSSATVNTNEASVSFWFKMTTNNETLRSIAEIAYGSGNFTIGQTGNNIGIIPIANRTSSITIMASLTVDSWYNIYADTNGVLYLNNSPTTNIATTAFYSDPVNGVRIGRRTKTAGSDSIGGEIDQFRIFNRALTQAEVNILYQEGASSL